MNIKKEIDKKSLKNLKNQKLNLAKWSNFRWTWHEFLPQIWKEGITTIFKNHIIRYPTPITISYFWGLGSLAGLMLSIQLVSGILLAMHYVPNVMFAFNSVEHIMRDIQYGWLLRYVHSNGASFFFLVVYVHMARGLFYRSFDTNPLAWLSGMLLFVLMMATAFLGYVLPWGQMSFWGATVITNFVTVIPLYGKDIAFWLWGGFAIDNPTLNRFFSLHFFLPFIIAGLSITHIALLHSKGSSNPLGIKFKHLDDYTTLYPYFMIKDVVGVIGILLIFVFFIGYWPNVLGHADNYTESNPLVTPIHIVPEWYFLPYYAVLRACPDKVGGILSMVGVILAMFLLPLSSTKPLNKIIEQGSFRKLSIKYFYVHRLLAALIIFTLILLGWLGGMPASGIYVLISKIASISLFIWLFFSYFLPISTRFSKNTKQGWQ